MKELKVGSDYSGVGAFDQSLIRLGLPYKKVFACDFDYNARITYILNFGTEEDLILALSKEHKMFCSGMEFIILGKSEEKDISEFEKKCKKLNITGSDLKTKKFNFAIIADKYAATFSFYYPFNVYDRQIPEEPLDIFMTSPPCQAFSLAGKRLGKNDIKGILFFNSLEFIQENKPEVFIFENVKGLLSDDKTNKKALYGNTFQEWINYLGGKSVNGNPTFFPYEDSVPYHIYFKVLNAKEYGIPQNRERIFIIGIRDDSKNKFNFPMTFPLEKRLKDILEPVVDEKYFLSDEMVSKLIKDNGKEFINQNTQASQVHNLEEVFPTLCAGTHGYASGYIKDEIIQLNDPIRSNDRIYSELGISPTLNTMQGGNRQPFVQVAEVVQLNESKESGGKQPYQHNRVYCINGVSPALDTDSGGRKNIFLEEYKIAAIRGRNPVNPKSRESGLETVQMLEINESGVSNCLTTVGKDNVLVINSNINTIFDGKLNYIENETNTGKILLMLQQEIGKKTIETWGFRIMEIIRKEDLLQQRMHEKRFQEQRKEIAGRNNNSNEPTSSSKFIAGIIMRSLPKEEWNRCTSQRRKSIKQLIRKFNESLQIMPHEDSQSETALQITKLQYKSERLRLLRETLSKIQEIWESINKQIQRQRIRRLTPTEAFRLMDFNPEMIEKTISSGLISDSQLYKEAGNSICVGVLVELIKKLLNDRT